MKLDQIIRMQKVSLKGDYKLKNGEVLKQGSKAIVKLILLVGGEKENAEIIIKSCEVNHDELVKVKPEFLNSALTSRDKFLLNLKNGDKITIKKTLEKIYVNENFKHLDKHGENIVDKRILKLAGKTFRIIEIDHNCNEVTIMINNDIEYIPFFAIKKPN